MSVSLRNALFIPVNPRPMLQELVNKDILVRLKWGQTEYKGRLVSVDSYMNIQLTNTEEFIDGKSTGSLGQVLIRFVLCKPTRSLSSKGSLACGRERFD
ncbi:MAG: hypothetical protein M1827_002551 [Pycnora praestabilis]|nr:MAG: hypothetical protein M1827_002551 [Pycnora praestabilis]